MNQAVSYLIKDNLPPTIKIDELGWNTFLKKWNDDVFNLAKKSVLKYGFASKGWIDEYKRLLINNNIEFQEEIFTGGHDYPPHKNEERIVQKLLANIIEVITFLKNNQTIVGNDYVYEILLNNGLLYPSIDKSSIEKTEKRIEMKLPASYKAFLRVSNGMLSVYGRLLPVNEIDWLRIRDKDVMETWWIEGDEPDYFVTDEDYLDYNSHGVFGAPDKSRIEYLEDCLEIGDGNQIRDNSAFWLLNPAIQTALNDWETWVWSPGDPSLLRYRNFKEMMENRYRFDVAALRIDLFNLEEE